MVHYCVYMYSRDLVKKIGYPPPPLEMMFFLITTTTIITIIIIIIIVIMMMIIVYSYSAISDRYPIAPYNDFKISHQ